MKKLLAVILTLGLPVHAAPQEKDSSKKKPRDNAAVSLNYGYYLIGRYGWTIDDLVESRDKFETNYASSAEEYKLQTTLETRLGQSFKLRVSAHALRTVDHRGGLDAFLAKAKDEELSDKALKIKKEIAKAQAAA